MPLLFLALLLVPIIEIALFIEIGGAIGTWATVAAIIGTALIGAVLLQTQGTGLIARARATLARGEMPVEEVIHGLFLLIAGVLLLTPGFLTDAFGFLLCIPPLRLALGKAVLRRIRRRVDVHVTRPPSDSRPEGAQMDEGEQGERPGSGTENAATKWRPLEEPQSDRRR